MLPLATSGAVDLLIYCGEILTFLQGFLTTRVVIVVRMEVCKIRALKSVATSLKASITVVSSVDQICQILFAHLVT